MPTTSFSPTSKSASRLAALSPQTKVAIMIGSDAVLLPACMLAAMSLRLGSIEAAFDTAPLLQIGVALLALPALGVAGLYRTVVRYIDLRVLVASSAALAAVVLFVSALAWSSKPGSCRARCCRSSGSCPSPTSSRPVSSPGLCFGAA